MHLGRKTETGGVAEDFALALEQQCMIGLAKPDGRLAECVEYGLQIECRAADHLQHVGSGGLRPTPPASTSRRESASLLLRSG
jgi:hypothetical protein